jgi:BirA family biotin operon repressor/biotin-[acetyl-CoA-carboxylase] ligase
MTENALSKMVDSRLGSLPFARTVLHCPSVDSTNTLAKSLLLQSPVDLPLLVWADIQTLGRGRGANQWWSDEGSLTFTVGLDPAAHGLRIDQEPRLALVAALAMIEAINDLRLSVPEIGIRWPNDVEAKGRKLCGILPERVEAEGTSRLLIGVGVNVLSCIDQAPTCVRRMATSLSALHPLPLSPSILPRLLKGWLNHFESNLERLAREDPSLANFWNNLNLLHEQIVRVLIGPRVIEGRVLEIDAHGALCLNDGKQILRLFGGQVLREELEPLR